MTPELEGQTDDDSVQFTFDLLGLRCEECRVVQVNPDAASVADFAEEHAAHALSYDARVREPEGYCDQIVTLRFRPAIPPGEVMK